MILLRMLKGMAFLVVGSIVALLITVLLVVGLFTFGVPFAFAVGVIAVVGFAGYIIRRHWRTPERGRTIVRVEPLDQLHWHDCEHCTSGKQALLDGGWGPIPMNMRNVQDGKRIIFPPLANVRDCNSCGGRGGFLLPYPPKREEVVKKATAANPQASSDTDTIEYGEL